MESNKQTKLINEKTINILYNLYYKQQNYDGVDGLYKKAKDIDKSIKRDDVKEWLNKQQTKQITNKTNLKKSFLPIYSETPYSFQLDLTFFPRYKKQNNNNYVLFTAININTRYAYAYYGKDKEMDTILQMIEKMEKKTVINSITCDEGTEFTNKRFRQFCLKNNIELIFVKDDSHKLGIINRFHRTLKNKISTHFIATDNLNWIDAIDKIIYNYNHSVNRGIGIEPYKVDEYLEHEMIVFKRVITELLNKKKNNNFEVGDKVRIMNKKLLFQDKMLPHYSNNIYIVERVFKNACLLRYGKDELRVKKDQIIKNNVIDNEKELIQIPKYMKEYNNSVKLLKEDLVDVPKPEKEKRIEKVELEPIKKKEKNSIDFIKKYLEGKLMTFERKDYKIDKVVYSYTYKNYLVEFNKEEALLYEVLESNRRKDWFKEHRDIFEEIIKKYNK